MLLKLMNYGKFNNFLQKKCFQNFKGNKEK